MTGSPLPWSYHRKPSETTPGHRDWIEDANARLIAATPELLEALSDLVTLIDNVAPAYSKIGAVVSARAALAKVCRLDDLCDQPAEVKANARLIAAAPELLAVLVAIHGQLVDQSINFGPLIADAEKAIAKAKGQP